MTHQLQQTSSVAATTTGPKDVQQHSFTPSSNDSIFLHDIPSPQHQQHQQQHHDAMRRPRSLSPHEEEQQQQQLPSSTSHSGQELHQNKAAPFSCPSDSESLCDVRAKQPKITELRLTCKREDLDEDGGTMNPQASVLKDLHQLQHLELAFGDDVAAHVDHEKLERAKGNLLKNLKKKESCPNLMSVEAKAIG